MSVANWIEHKRELTKALDIEKEVIVFLNYLESGIIYIGFDKEGSVTGVEDVDSGMTEKGSFIRVGTASEPMPQKMIEELFAKRTRNSLGKIDPEQSLLGESQETLYLSIDSFFSCLLQAEKNRNTRTISTG